MSKVLIGHVSPETAHLTFAYPSGRTKCVRREWIEHPTKGPGANLYRFVTQTTVKAFNIDYTERIAKDGQDAADAWATEVLTTQNGRFWNAPKPSTYSFLMVMVQDPLPDGSGRIGTSHRSLSMYPNAETVATFVDGLEGELPAEEQHRLDATRRAVEASQRARESKE